MRYVWLGRIRREKSSLVELFFVRYMGWGSVEMFLESGMYFISFFEVIVGYFLFDDF